MAPLSSTLAWKIPWTEEPGRLQSTGSAKSQTRLSNFTFTFHFHVLEKEMATHSSVLAWRIPGMAEPGGLLSMGLHRVRYDWSDLAAAAAAAAVAHWGSMKLLLFSHSVMSNSFVNPWTIVHRLLCPSDFPGKNTRVLPLPSPGDLLESGIEPMSLALQADSLPLSHLESPLWN